MINDRYYYTKLSDCEKAAYKAMYDGFMRFDVKISFPRLTDFDREFVTIWRALIDDNPHLYYVDESDVMIFSLAGEMELRVNYSLSKSEVTKINKSLQNNVNDIVKEIICTCGNDEEAREEMLYKYFVTNCRYTQNAKDEKDLQTQLRFHSMLGPILDKSAVCDGFARAFKFVMNAMDMKCIVVSGDAVEPTQNKDHAWNIVKIEDNSYHTDITWALAINSGESVWHDMLNLSDAEISLDHFNFGNVPKCPVSRSYYKQNDLEIDNRIFLKNHIRRALDERLPACEFKLVKGYGKCAFTGNDDIAKVAEEAYYRALRESRESGKIDFEAQYSQARKTCIMRFTYG